MQGPAFVKIDGVSLTYRLAEEETLAVEDLNIDIHKANSSPWSGHRAAANPP